MAQATVNLIAKSGPTDANADEHQTNSPTDLWLFYVLVLVAHRTFPEATDAFPYPGVARAVAIQTDAIVLCGSSDQEDKMMLTSIW